MREYAYQEKQREDKEKGTQNTIEQLAKILIIAGMKETKVLILIIHSLEYIEGENLEHCAYIEYKEIGIINPYQVRESSRMDKSK